MRTPAGGVEIDPLGRMDGRGAYVCRDVNCINTALDRGSLARALRVGIPAALAGELAARTQLEVIGGGVHGQE